MGVIEEDGIVRAHQSLTQALRGGEGQGPAHHGSAPLCVPSHRWNMYLMAAAPRSQDAEASASAVALALALAMAVCHGGGGGMGWSGPNRMEGTRPNPPSLPGKARRWRVSTEGLKVS